MNKKINRFVIVSLILAIFILLLGTILTVHTFISLRGQSPFAAPYSRNIRQKKISVKNIQSWMTFDFINKSFALPPEYLKTNLGITDKKYPNISVDHWSRENFETSATVIDQIKKLILDFQNALPSPSTNVT